ncbi:undecaprenyl-phosphate 4-deoxy-4-formamido-L-arabinose transferase [Rhizobium skierniewicense]|uniref:Undecaprenyl-phosphate 4-deoxy-4-formamido-L-arabinose transferase n=1 Tax=Rhizobium skierniewicense TaxID=984260 RepID=A0A7W6CC89_9HYPH|nr:glycosyltransferase family 2 protein [Rhizobium skierniewicense]MBB3944596.1 undecaprenyl-phosphate 4-deoxy-4-formamido-L-arabinose transferase [Rhizobium skierniewicense]
MEGEPALKLSVVIPAYGSELTLPELVRQLEVVLSDAPNVLGSYEIILVCDHSPDGTWEVIKQLAATRSKVSGVLLRMNAGQHNALMAGFTRASGAVVVTMDDDLQHSPHDIPRLVEKVDEGYDVVYGRFTNRSHAAWKVIGSKFNNTIAAYLMKKPMDLYLSPFRAFRSVICKDILSYSGPYVYVDGLILTFTRNIASVEVNHFQRFAGDSRYGLKKSISLWLKMATSFSLVPLRLTSLLGIIVSGFGFLCAFLLIVQKLTIDVMPVGWASLIVAVLVIGGVQLLALGVIGEYLGRVLLTINSRPQYVIGETTDALARTQDQKL